MYAIFVHSLFKGNSLEICLGEVPIAITGIKVHPDDDDKQVIFLSQHNIIFFNRHRYHTYLTKISNYQQFVLFTR
jgi:hypothetical protein